MSLLQSGLVPRTRHLKTGALVLPRASNDMLRVSVECGPEVRGSEFLDRANGWLILPFPSRCRAERGLSA